jgi:hypothetical protein
MNRGVSLTVADLRRATELLEHVWLLEPHDRVQVQTKLGRHTLDGAAAAPAPHITGEALRLQRVLQQKLQFLPLHGATEPGALPAGDRSIIPARQILHTPLSAVIPSPMRHATRAADCFFVRRARVKSRACGSPKIPVRTPEDGNRETCTCPPAGGVCVSWTSVDHAKFPRVLNPCRAPQNQSRKTVILQSLSTRNHEKPEKDYETYLATVAKMLTAEEADEATSLLRMATTWLAETGYDNWMVAR